MHSSLIVEPTIICLTPVKNEAWILDSFLKYNSIWADYIIVLDQLSTDNTKEIIEKYPKAIYIENKSLKFNEDIRQIRLIEKARELPGDKKIFIALDADEILSSNAIKSKEWQDIKQLEKGTVIKFPWFNINSDTESGWFAKNKVAFGFVDDGSEHIPQKIHSTRIPFPKNANVYETNDIVNLHFQYIDLNRNRKKQRWYMCWERLNFPQKHAIDIFRQYNNHNTHDRIKVQDSWLSDFEDCGKSIFSCRAPEFTWWDLEILQMIEKYGNNTFRQLDIWDCDWNDLANRNIGKLMIDYNLSNNKGNTFALKWLKATQLTQDKIYNRVFQRLLRFFWN